MLNSTTLPDKRVYETYKEKDSRDYKCNEVRRKGYKEIETGEYKSMSWYIYYLIYRPRNINY